MTRDATARVWPHILCEIGKKITPCVGSAEIPAGSNFAGGKCGNVCFS